MTGSQSGKNKTMGEKFRLLIENSGKNNEQVAALLDVSPQRVGMMIKQESFTGKIVSKIAEAFNVEPSYFYKVNEIVYKQETRSEKEMLMQEIINNQKDTINDLRETNKDIRNRLARFLERFGDIDVENDNGKDKAKAG